MKTLHLLIGIVLFATLLVVRCDDKAFDRCVDPTPQFSVDEFVNQIETRLESQPISGYQFVVNKDRNFYYDKSVGLGRHRSDPGGPQFISWAHRFDVASISKFIGTIALLNAMEEHEDGISLDDKVSTYLPDTWFSQVHWLHNDPKSTAYLTFRKLLTNQTAINFPNSPPPPGTTPTEAQMLQGLRSTPDFGRIGKYQNGNFTLIRVLIGEIIYRLDETKTDYSDKCTEKYYEYLDEKIFSPLNLTCPSSPQEINSYFNNSAYPMAYQYPFDELFRDNDGRLGWAHTSDPYKTGGSAGLILSARDIAKIMAFFRHDNSELIISKEQRNLILNDELGLVESLSGDHGRYQSKGGLRGPDGKLPHKCCERAIRSKIMFFPNDVEAVIITNSNHKTLGALLREAYDASWIDPC